MDEQRPWHRFFALWWTDLLLDQPVTVDPEKDLSFKKQLLDVLLIRKETEALTCRIRVIVANQLPQQEHNAMLHLFSTRAELLKYGASHYRIRSSQTSTLLRDLIKRSQQEGLIMPDMRQELEEYARESIDRL